MPDLPKIAVCGGGRWGKNLVRNIAECGALAAVVDADPTTANALASQHRVPAMTFEAVLDTPSIQGIVLATPAVTHVALAARALEAGKHVFVEKPLALDAAGARRLQALAQRRNKTLMVGHLMHYHPAFLALKREVASGRIGAMHCIRARRLNFGAIRPDEDVLWSFAPHDFSMILELTRALPQSLSAQGHCVVSPGIADDVHVQMRFGSVTASVEVSWLHPVKEHVFAVTGEKGSLVFDDGQPWESKLRYHPHRVDLRDGGAQAVREGEPQALAVVAAEPLRAECLGFLSAIMSGGNAAGDLQDAIRVVDMLTAASKALRLKKEIPMRDTLIHETAVIDEGATIGEGTRVWHFSHVLPGSRIGRDVVIGQNVMIGPDVTVGDRCKIQNNVSLYRGVTLEDGVFCGPSCVFTNVNTPRAEVERKNEFRPTLVGRGATIGANATVVCGHRIGAYSFIGAGAVVTDDVRPHALVVGNPARQIGWMSHAGERLTDDLVCPREKRRYRVNAQGDLEEVTGRPPQG